MTNTNFECDRDWGQQNGLSDLTELRGLVELARFCDADGTERSSVRELVQQRIREVVGEGTAQIDVEFSELTFLEGFTVESPLDFPLKRLKIVRFRTTITVVETYMERPFRSEE